MPGSAESSSGAMSPSSDSRESGGQHAGNLTPARFQQRQRVQCQRVQEAAAGVRVVGEHPRRLALPGRRDRGAQHVAEECAWSVDTISTRRPLRASRTAVAVASVDLPTPPLPTKRLIRALARRSGIHSASTRFLRSFKAVSVSLRSALRLSRPIIGMTRSTESS